MSRTEPDLEWTHRPSLEATLTALRKTKIGPLFPADPGRRRPVRGRLAEHVGKRHPKLAAAG